MLGHARPDYFVRDGEGRLQAFRRGGRKEQIEDVDVLGTIRNRHPIIYTHIFGEHPPTELPSVAVLEALGEAMRLRSLAHAGDPVQTSGSESYGIPAGYTYLGQFILHDVTAMLPRDPGEKVWKSGRSPALDLDSVLDAIRPGDDLAVSSLNGLFTVGYTTGNVQSPDDLPRIPEAEETAPDRGRPLVADSRNDDFLPLAQCHLLLLKFFNAIALYRGYDGTSRDSGWWHQTRRLWVQCFQAIVLLDYLPRIIDPVTYADVMTGGRKIVLPDVRASSTDWFPLEVAGALGRYGHSMIRDSYAPWNSRMPGPAFAVEQFMEFSWMNSNDCLAGHQFGLPGVWRTNWFKLFDLRGNGQSGIDFDPFLASPIDTRLAASLFQLPQHVLSHSVPHCMAPAGTGQAPFNLAAQTLARGRELGLATAQQAVPLAGQMIGQPLPMLATEDLFPDDLNLTGPQASALAQATPLWYYMLREAECLGGGRLGPFAGRVVMETIHATIAASGSSVLRESAGDTALQEAVRSMPDLIAFISNYYPWQ